MYGNQRIAVVNLDKREFVTIDSPAKLLASTNHIPQNERGASHDTFVVGSKTAISAYKTYMGYLALIGPKDEMTDLLSNTDPEAVPNRNRYGSWYGDRVITYSVTSSNPWSTSGTNPFKTATNDFTEITEQVRKIGDTLFNHYNLTKTA